MRRRLRTDSFAAVLIEDSNGFEMEGLSVISENGSAVIGRRSKNLQLSGSNFEGAVNGAEFYKIKDSKLSDCDIISHGRMPLPYAYADMRDRIDEELNNLKVSQSVRESIKQDADAIFEARKSRSKVREKCDQFLERYSNLATSIEFTWASFSNILKTFS